MHCGIEVPIWNLKLTILMEKWTMCKKQQNIYVVEMDMKDKSVEDIARKAALQIIGITDALIDRQMRVKLEQKEVVDG